MPIINFINQMWIYLIFFLKNLNFETITQIKVQMNYKNIYIWGKVVCLFCSNGLWNQGHNDTRKVVKFEIHILKKIKLTSNYRRPQVVNIQYSRTFATQVQMPWNQAHAPLLLESFPKRPRTRSEASWFPGCHQYKTKQTNYLAS